MRQDNSSDIYELFKKCFLKIRHPLLIPALLCSAAALASFKIDFAPEFLIIISVFLITASFLTKRKLRNFIGFILCITCAFSIKSYYNKIETAECFKETEISGTYLITDLKSESGYQKGNLKIISGSSNIIKRGTKISFFSKNSRGLSKGEIISGKLKIKNGIYRDHPEYSVSQGILYKTFIGNDISISGNNIIYSSADRVAKYITSLANCYTDKNSSATILGIMLGDKTGFSEKFSLNIRHSGVSHVMVVSGMHLAIIMGSFRAIIKKFGLNKYLNFIISNAFLIFFMAVCGFTQSVMRAGIMYMILSLAGIFNREGDSINALSLAVIIILIKTPFAVMNISFQLSVLSTLGILCSGQTVMKIIRFKSKILKLISDSALTSVSALLFTLPVVIFRFKEFSLVSVVTNLLISYAVTSVLTLMLAAAAISLMPFCRIPLAILFKILQISADYINKVVNYLGTRKYSFIECSDKTVCFSLIILFVFLVCCAGCKYYYIKTNSLKNEDEKECRLSLKQT